MRKIKRGLTKIFRRFDRAILRGFRKFFRVLYKIKPLRPLLRPSYRFVNAHYRLSASVLALLMIVSVAVPVLQRYQVEQKYVLGEAAHRLLGDADPDLVDKLSFDAPKQVYEFNKSAKDQPKPTGNPMAALKTQVGGSGKDDVQLYSMDAPRDLTQGITYYENQMGLKFKITPQFSTLPAEVREGHLVYPLSGNSGQVAYTVTATGLKQNVLLYESPGDSLSMSYALDLPSGLEARMIDETGEVGLYSPDPSVFASIDYQASDAQVRVAAAWSESEKTYLVFKIPAPVVMMQGKVDQASIGNVKSHFVLNDNVLTVVTTGLDKAEYPLAIDPTVSIDSASEFGSGTVEDNNQTLASGNVTRGGLTGGGVGGWTLTTALDNSNYRSIHVSVAYNGYVYIVGGNTNSGYDNYAPLNSDGTIGTWSTVSAAKSYTCFASAAAYNGYFYMAGGTSDCGANWSAAVNYTPIASNGDLTGWQSAQSLPAPKTNAALVAYKGYLYMVGGYNGSNVTADVVMAPIKTDGSIGSWTSTTSLGTARYAHQAAVYNDYIYAYGGLNASDVSQASVEYAPINSDGTVGTWTATTSFTTARHSFRGFAYNGYLYLTGGTANMSSGMSDVQYAPINANGTIGTWVTTSALPDARWRHTSVAYNGYMYVLGGVESGPTTVRYQAYYTKINDPGGLAGSAFSTTNAFTTGRDGFCSVAYNGYMYVMGGRNSSNTYLRDIYYAAINANGTVGSGAWTNNANQFPAANSTGRWFQQCTAYNGYMYVLGGYNGGATFTTTHYASIASDGSIGTFSNATSLPSVVAGSSAVAYNGYMYIIGSDTGGTKIVRYTTIATNGSLGGTWTSTNQFSATRDWSRSAFAYNGYMYILGGSSNGANNTYLNTVEYAPINSDGSLGTWNSTTSFTNARDSAAVTAYNGYVYLAGGISVTGGVTTYRSDVQYAPINANGTLGTWQATTSMADSVQNAQAMAYNGNVYFIGGLTSNPTFTTAVRYLPVNNGGPGTTGTWSSTSSFTNTRYGHGSVAYNGYMYVLGGFNGTAYADIQYAPISRANGTLSSWNSAGSDFTTARYGLDSFVYNGYIYMMGGTTNGSVYLNDVQYAALNSNGTIGSWQTTTSFPTARYGHHVVVYNGYIYVTGGNSGSARNDVQYAPINTDGTIGNWSSAGTFTNARYGHDATINNGYLYIMAGNNNGTYYSDVQVAQIQGNGSLGSWTSLTPFNNARYGIDSFVYNGYLYVVGGYNGTSYYNDVQYAPIAQNGHIGQWQSTTTFTTARYVHTALAYNGYMYVLGGNGGSYLNNVYYAPMNVMPRKATYSKVLSLGSTSKITGVNYTGNLIDGLRNIKYRFANSAGTFPTTASRGADLPFTCDAGTHVQVLATIDNTTSSVFPDSAGTLGQINSITVTYDAPGVPTDKRLRHGAYFSSEELQPFDIRGCS